MQFLDLEEEFALAALWLPQRSGLQSRLLSQPSTSADWIPLLAQTICSTLVFFGASTLLSRHSIQHQLFYFDRIPKPFKISLQPRSKDIETIIRSTEHEE